MNFPRFIGVDGHKGERATQRTLGYTGLRWNCLVEDIRRLLAERPDAVGLVVPGMPLGSPGMEGPDPEPYNVLLLKRDGTTQVFQRHTGRNHD